MKRGGVYWPWRFLRDEGSALDNLNRTASRAYRDNCRKAILDNGPVGRESYDREPSLGEVLLMHKPLLAGKRTP
jgi:hypothetical protein